jgi:hypothetical protein
MPESYQYEMHLDAASTPYRGSARTAPRATSAGFWCGLGLVFLSIIGAACLIKARSDAVALERDSTIVEGRVLARWVDGRRHVIAYVYHAPNGTVHSSEARVTPEHYAGLRVEGSISVKVCRSDPANHQVVGAFPRVFSTRATVPFYTGVLIVLAAVGVTCLWLWWASACRARD